MSSYLLPLLKEDKKQLAYLNGIVILLVYKHFKTFSQHIKLQNIKVPQHDLVSAFP